MMTKLMMMKSPCPKTAEIASRASPKHVPGGPRAPCAPYLCAAIAGTRDATWALR